MNLSDVFHLIVRWAHLLSGAAWLGGITFWFLVLNPTTRAFPSFGQYLGQISGDFKRLVDTCVFVLLSTGAIMTFNRITPGDIGSDYLLVLGAKIAIVIVMLFIIRAKRPAFMKSREAELEIPRASKKKFIINFLTGYNLLLILGAATFLLSDILNMIYTSALQK